MRYFVSDIHLFHRKILTFCRPQYSDLEAMHKDIISIWNSTVKPDDTVYNLGDLTFQAGSKKDDINAVLNQLNGYHILLRGNHDDDKKISNFPAIREYHKNLEINIHGIDFLMGHFSYKENMIEKDILERPECFTEKRYKDDDIMPLLSGHTHDKWAVRKNNLCVCFDIWNRPISEDEIWKIYEITNKFQKDIDNRFSLGYT